jgi:prepilin-type processing-associated H-X9-DG protein
MTSNVPPGTAFWRRITAPRRSTERALVMDGFHYGAAKNNVAAYRHEGKANVIFCDGHGELRRQQDIPCDWNGVNDWQTDYFWGAERKD